LANYLEDDTVTDELRKAFPELALRQQPDADPDSAEIDMAEERRRFEREITVALRKMGSDVRGMFVLHDLTLRSAANMLPPGELDILLEDYRNSRDPFDLLTAFLLLKQAGREVEAMPLMHDIAGLSPDGGKAEAAMAALPSLLNAYGWHVHATRVTRRTASAAEPNVELAFKLHDPLAILAQVGEQLFRLRRLGLVVQQRVLRLAFHVGLTGEDEDLHSILGLGRSHNKP